MVYGNRPHVKSPLYNEYQRVMLHPSGYCPHDLNIHLPISHMSIDVSTVWKSTFILMYYIYGVWGDTFVKKFSSLSRLSRYVHRRWIYY